jgi:hypothetical protein
MADGVLYVARGKGYLEGSSPRGRYGRNQVLTLGNEACLDELLPLEVSRP